MIQHLREYFTSLEKDAIPQISINIVILGFHENTLQLIVNKVSFGRKDLLVLPGGYIFQNEDLEEAVKRIVRDSTGLENILLKQFAVFGNADRSFGKEFAAALDIQEDSSELDLSWFSRRFLSICFLALVDYQKITLHPTQFFDKAEWLPIQKADDLSIDHAEIVQHARETLLKELPYSPIESNLLPPKFTLPELHKLFQAILGRTINRPNFRRKMLQSGLLSKVGKDGSGKGRPADLYMFKNGRETNFNNSFKYGF